MDYLGKKIKQIAQQKQISIKYLASKIKMTETGYHAMIRNKSIKLATLLKISEVLDVPMVYWFHDDEHPEKDHQVILDGDTATLQGKDFKITATNSGAQDAESLQVELEKYMIQKNSLERELAMLNELINSKAQLLSKLKPDTKL